MAAMLKCALPADVAARLQATVLTYCAGDARIFTCTFVPGGKQNGVGVLSPIWCKTCGHPLMWHDVASALAATQAHEDVA
jgi:hypothetical protein